MATTANVGVELALPSLALALSIRSVVTTPPSRSTSLPLLVDPSMSIDTGRPPNWAVGARPLSGRRGVCIADVSAHRLEDGRAEDLRRQRSYGDRSQVR